jgi:hypothetical protein
LPNSSSYETYRTRTRFRYDSFVECGYEQLLLPYNLHSDRIPMGWMDLLFCSEFTNLVQKLTLNARSERYHYKYK